MHSLESCAACASFVPVGATTCPGCGTEHVAPTTSGRFATLRRGLGRLLGVTSAACMAMTLMACYGAGAYDDPCYDGSGYCDPPLTCDDDDDCTSGYYCADLPGQNEMCTWGGYCNTNSDCPTGFVCDWRDTCVPSDVITCSIHDDCSEGDYCDGDLGACVDSTFCSIDAECPADFQCDVDRYTCVPCGAGGCAADDGHCDGPVTCPDAAPACPLGSTPGVLNGCYTDACIPDDACTSYCEDIDNDPDCITASDCQSVYVGIDCAAPDGAPCTTPGAMCECASFEFYGCVAAPPAP